MSNLKTFRRTTLLLTFLVLGFSFFSKVYAATGIQGQDGIKSTVRMKWINRAKIQVENINIVDDDSGRLGFNQSTQASAVRESNRPGAGEAGLNRMINIQSGNNAEYKDDNVFDGETFYDHPTCRDSSTLVFDDDYKIDETNRGALVLDSLVFKVEDRIERGGSPGECHFVIDATPGGRDNNGSVRLISEMGDTKNKNIWFEFEGGNDDAIKRVDGKQTYTRFKPAEGQGNPDEYQVSEAGGVKPNDDCDGSVTRVVLDSGQRKDTSIKKINAKWYTCDEAGVKDIIVLRNGDEGASDDIVNNPTDSTTPGGAPELDCEARLLNPLTWLMCPLIEAGTLAVESLDNAITDQLNFKTGAGSVVDESTQAGKALFNTWASFRYISLGVLVIIGLLMIISQALSFGIFDAYTIKKVLPKILIGVIGISISWYLCKFAIDIFNDLGMGVRSLLYGPFKDLNGARIDQRVVSLLGVGAGVAVVGLGVIGILSFVVTALLAVIIAFAILVFRQILIILLIVTAPLAIVCWILPNTEKVWKMWWDFFTKALIVFPIISLFIAGGRVIAQIATTTPDGQSPGFLQSTIAFIAYFGPYFALPAAFRLAGGAIATVGGFANDRSRGAFDRLKKGRQERYADRMARAKNDKLYNPNNAALKAWTGTKVGKVLNPNKMASWTAAPYKNAQYAARGVNIPGLSAAGRRLESGIHASAIEQSEKMLQHVNKHGANDKFYRAIGGMYRGFNSETQNKLVEAGMAKWEKDDAGNITGIQAVGALKSEKDFQKMAHILATSDSDSEQKAAVALEANAAYMAGLYADEDMNYASTAVTGAMGLAAHGFFNPDDAADAGNLIASSSESGSVDFAHAAVVQAEAIGASKNPDVKPGYGHAIKDGKFVSGNKDVGRSWGALETFAQGDFASTKSSFYDSGRTGGKIRELIQATRGTEEQKSAVKAKWQKEILDGGGSLQDASKAIKKRLAQAPAVVAELQQVAGPYSQAPIDSRAKVEAMLNEYNIPIPGAGGVDPEFARGGGGGGGGGGAGPDLGGPNLSPPDPNGH